MIKNCFTDKTKVIEIEIPELIKYRKRDEQKLELMAQKLSEETNVPKSSIYTGKYVCRIGNWHKIDGEYHYFKPLSSSRSFYNELLGEFISLYFDLESVDYHIAKLMVDGQKEQYGLLSKNFCTKEYTYKTLFDYISECSELHLFANDLSIVNKIETICQTKEETALLQDDLKKLFIRHFYNTQCDGGNGQNIMLKKSEAGIRLATLYDYAFAYVGLDDLSRYVWDVGELNVENEDTQNLFRDDPRFQELLYKLMDADIFQLLKQAEEKHNIVIPLKQKNEYSRYEKRVKELVLENKLIK